MKRRMWLVRGLSGSGKSTLAKMIAEWSRARFYEADDYFVGDDGVYRFDPSKLAEAHKECLDAAMDERTWDVVVANTFTQRWEMQPYIEHARNTGMELRVITLDTDRTDEQLAERNVHGVTAEVIAAQRARFERDWENGNPIAPWNR